MNALDPTLILMVAGAVAVLRPLIGRRADGPQRVFALALACAGAALAYRAGSPSTVRIDDAVALACAALGGATLLDRVGMKALAGKLPAGPLRDALTLAPEPSKPPSEAPLDGPAKE